MLKANVYYTTNPSDLNILRSLQPKMNELEAQSQKNEDENSSLCHLSMKNFLYRSTLYPESYMIVITNEKDIWQKNEK